MLIAKIFYSIKIEFKINVSGPRFLLIMITTSIVMIMMTTIVRQPKSSQLELKVHANPRNLNASAMAAILNNDSALTDHANNHLGINIKGFEAGSKVRIDQ